MIVASSVASVLDVECVGGVFLCCSTGEISFALLSDNVLYVSFFGLEVIAHCLGFVVGATLAEYGFAGEFAGGVFASDGLYGVVAQVHLDLGRVELYVAIRYRAVSIHECRVAAYYYHRVG